jgi:aldo/keto reductase family protein
MTLNRRRFLQAGAAVIAASHLFADEATGIPKRMLGKTGVKVPILGLGTVALGAISNEKDAVKLLNKAIDSGVTYIDTAPPRTRQALFTGYGKAQKYISGVLKERRKEVFVVTKCLETDGSKTLDLVRSNLKELGIAQADLIHTHSIGHAIYDFDELVGEHGPMAALVKARKDGLTRFVGITGHNRPEKFAKVIAKRDIDVMMNAVNVVDRHTYDFEDGDEGLRRRDRLLQDAGNAARSVVSLCAERAGHRRGRHRHGQHQGTGAERRLGQVVQTTFQGGSDRVKETDRRRGQEMGRAFGPARFQGREEPPAGEYVSFGRRRLYFCRHSRTLPFWSTHWAITCISV